MAEVTNQVIAITLDIRDVKAKFQELARINTLLTNQLGKDFSSATKIISQSVDKIKIGNIIDPVTGKQTQQVLGNLSTVFKDAQGNVKTFSEQVKVLNNGSLQSLNSTLKNGGKVTRGFGDDIKTLAGRALLTIPIWLALRGAILGLFAVFTDGFKNIVEFDLALQKIKRNLSGTPEDIAASMETIRTEITKTSIALGVSTEKIAGAVKEFATLGFNAQDALAGGIGATKLAVVLFGDAADTAEAFAGALNLLIDKSKGAKSATEQFNEVYALVAELGKNNKDSIKGTAEGLKNFASTAKSLNLNAKETITVLATLSTALLDGAKGGTLASTAFQTFIGNLDKTAGVLGISVNPKLEGTANAFVRVIDQINLLGETQGISAQTRAINALFNGLKSAKPIRALIADLNKFKQNLQITGDVNSFNQAVNAVTDTLSKQVDIFHNLNREIGKAFITGLTGGDDLKESLKQINGILEQNVKGAKELGKVLGFLAKSAIIFPTIAFAAGVEDAKAKVNDLRQALLELTTKGLQGTLGTDKLKETLTTLTLLSNKGDISISPRLLGQLRKQLETQVNNELAKKEIEVKVAADTKITASDISFLTTKEEAAIRKLIVQDQIEQLKAQGATTSELLKQEGLLNKQFGIVEDENSILERKLATQRALTAEQRLQNKLGSDSLKLFEIAQTSGTDVAKQIGDVLAGNVDFTSFIRRGGEAVDVFKKEFDDVFKNQQAQAFFQGDRVPGLDNLRGGQNIAIQEEQIRQGLTRFNPQAQAALNQANAQIPTIRNDIRATIEMNVNVQGLSFREAVARMKDEMSKEILNPNSEIGKATTQRIEGF